MRKIKSVLGVLLILISIGGLFFWEWKGREAILMDEVLVAAEEIEKGTEIDSSMFIVKGVPKDNLLEGALAQEDLGLLQGKTAAQMIAANDQILIDYFETNEFRLKQDESIFVLDPEWISMRSSSLRRGDVVDIFGTNGFGLLGTYRIAYVKDASEREIIDAGDDNKLGGGRESGSSLDILDRPDSSAVIDHIEIISTFSEYEYLTECISGADGITPAALIIVQRGDRLDT